MSNKGFNLTVILVFLSISLFPVQISASNLFYKNDIYEFSLELDSSWEELDKEMIEKLSPNDSRRLIALFENKSEDATIFIRTYPEDDEKTIVFDNISKEYTLASSKERERMLKPIPILFGVGLVEFEYKKNRGIFELKGGDKDGENIKNILWTKVTDGDLLEVEINRVGEKVSVFQSDKYFNKIFSTVNVDNDYEERQDDPYEGVNEEGFWQKINIFKNIDVNGIIDFLFEPSKKYNWVPYAFLGITILFTVLSFSNRL